MPSSDRGPGRPADRAEDRAPPACDDDEFLDRVLARAIESLHEGRSPRPDDLLEGREALRPQVEELLAMARDVAQRRVPSLLQVPGYQVLGELGRGAMGTVFLARHEKLDRDVALKVLPAGPLASGRDRDRFVGEARALARLRHPHVVTVHDVIEAEGLCAYAMDPIDGPSLARVVTWLAQDPGAPDLDRVHEEFALAPAAENYTRWICRAGADIARALHHAHEHGLLHRDVKPSNILLDRAGAALLADFGLVRDTDNPMGTQTGAFVGTAAYAAPEQLRGESQSVDRRSDVYALGATLYHAIALRVPYEGSSAVQITRAIETGSGPSFRGLSIDIPRDLEAIITMAMEPDPARRYASAAELADDLERLLALRPVVARHAGPWTRFRKNMRRQRRLVVAVLTTALLVLTVGIFVVADWQRRAAIPQRVAELLTEAHVHLLDPRQGERIFEVLELGRQTSDVAPAAGSEPALTDYDQLLALDPDHVEARIERDVLMTVRRIAGGEPADAALTDHLRSICPLTCATAVAWTRSRQQTIPPASALDNASRLDRRGLGLFGLLCGNQVLCLRAWEVWEGDADADPFVVASLGQLHLTQGREHLAYPRLQDAYRAFPTVGFLCVDLADAARRCGDLARAEHLLSLAQDLPHPAPWHGRERVLADLRADQGREDEARELYTWLLQRQPTPHTWLNAALWFWRSGEPEIGLELLRGLVFMYGMRPDVVPHFERVAASWWAGLSTEDARRALATFVNPRLPGPDLEDVLRVVAEARAAGGAPVETPRTWNRLFDRRRLLRSIAEASADQPASLRQQALAAALDAEQPPRVETDPPSSAAMPAAHRVRGPTTAAAAEPSWHSSCTIDGRRHAVGARLPERWTLAWQRPRASGRDEVVVARDRVIYRGGPSTLHAVGLHTGEPIWEHGLGPTAGEVSGPGCVVGDRVFVPLSTGDLRVAAISLRTGRRDWTWTAPGRGHLSTAQIVPGPMDGTPRVLVFARKLDVQTRPWTELPGAIAGRFILLDPGAATADEAAVAWSPPLGQLRADAPASVFWGPRSGGMLLAHGLAAGPTTSGIGAASARLLRLDLGNLRPLRPESWPELSRSRAAKTFDNFHGGVLVDEAAGRVYLYDTRRELLAFDILTGHELWRVPVAAGGSELRPYRVGTTIVLADCATPWVGGYAGGDGRCVFELTRQEGLTAPATWGGIGVTLDDGRLLLPLTDGSLVTVDAQGSLAGPHLRLEGLRFAIPVGGRVLVGTDTELRCYGH